MAATIMYSLICLIDCHNYRLKRLGILTLQYYRSLLLYNIAFSLIAVVFFFFAAMPINAHNFFVAKIIGVVCAMGLHNFSSKESYFYFRNAGYSMRKILVNALILDTLIYLALVTLLTAIPQLWAH
ncbi:MAG: hypothetical protein JWQ79_2836 [Mucilaginibacter sp.]|jgi:hypothetical protein|nr:hypothetical protein [Mucilaginibacter sp.]